MSIQINKESYQKLIKEDIEWLLKNTERDLERDHIIDVLLNSIDEKYPYEDWYDKEFKKWKEDIITTPIHKEYTDDWDWDDTKCRQCRHFDGYDTCMEEGQFGTVNTRGLNRCRKKNLFRQNI